MKVALPISVISRMVSVALLGLLLIPTTLALASTRDLPALRAEPVDWSGTLLSPSTNAPVGSQLTIRPPAGARLPQVTVQLAGQNLAIVSASSEEVRVQLPSQPVTGALTMTNAATRGTGTLAPEYRVVAAAPSAPRTPRTLSSAGPAGGSQQMSNNAYLLITAGGEDTPVLFGEDNTQNSQGAFDVSNHLEVVEFSVALHTGQQGAHGASQSTGQRIWHPARFVMRVGKSTPFLFEAARMNKRVDLTLRLFHRNHETGIVEQNFQYRIQQGRIVSVRLVKPGAQDAAATGLPYFVEIQVVPNVSEAESMTGGTVMVDDWAARGY